MEEHVEITVIIALIITVRQAIVVPNRVATGGSRHARGRLGAIPRGER